MTKEVRVSRRIVEGGKFSSSTQNLWTKTFPVKQDIQLGSKDECQVKVRAPYVDSNHGTISSVWGFFKKGIYYTNTSRQGTLIAKYDRDTDQIESLENAKLIHNEKIKLDTSHFIILVDEKGDKGFAFLVHFF